MKKSRLDDIDRAKGLGIFFVVFGHLFSLGNIPDTQAWYAVSKIILYTFHMSFFMFLSGFIMFYTFKPLTTIQDYRKYISKRFSRLMPAYIIFGLLIFLAKLIAQHFTEVGNPLDSIYEFINIFISPRQSFSRFLWFIYVIFLFYAVLPPLLYLTKQRLWPLLWLGLILYFFPRSDYFAFNYICAYFLTFVLGGILAIHHDKYINFLNHWGGHIFGIFLVSLTLVIPFQIEPFPVDTSIPRLMIGLLSIPSLHWLVRVKWMSKIRILSLLGIYSFPIYLMNTLIIGGSKMLLLKVLEFDRDFIILSALLLILGLYLPVLLKRIFLSRIPILDRITT